MVGPVLVILAKIGTAVPLADELLNPSRPFRFMLLLRFNSLLLYVLGLVSPGV